MREIEAGEGTLGDLARSTGEFSVWEAESKRSPDGIEGLGLAGTPQSEGLQAEVQRGGVHAEDARGTLLPGDAPPGSTPPSCGTRAKNRSPVCVAAPPTMLRKAAVSSI